MLPALRPYSRTGVGQGGWSCLYGKSYLAHREKQSCLPHHYLGWSQWHFHGTGPILPVLRFKGMWPCALPLPPQAPWFPQPVPYFISAVWILVSATSQSPQPIAPTRTWAVWPQITFFWCTVGRRHCQSAAAILAKAMALPVQTHAVPCSKGVAVPVTSSSPLQGGPALLALKASILSKHQCINSQKNQLVSTLHLNQAYGWIQLSRTKTAQARKWRVLPQERCYPIWL